jgi:ribonuclease BN (tRNA processing enzyme)
LFHDSQYTDEELPARAHFGHASAGYGVGLAERAGAKRLALFHFDPQRTDDEVQAMVARHRGASVRVDAAVQGDVIDLPGG